MMKYLRIQRVNSFKNYFPSLVYSKPKFALQFRILLHTSMSKWIYSFLRIGSKIVSAAEGHLLQRGVCCRGASAAEGRLLQRGVCCRGASAAEGRLLQRGVCCRGVSAAEGRLLQRGVCCRGASAAEGSLLQRGVCCRGASAAEGLLLGICMARFASVNEEEIRNILLDKDHINTKKSTNVLWLVLYSYMREKKVNLDVVSITKNILCWSAQTGRDLLIHAIF